MGLDDLLDRLCTAVACQAIRRGSAGVRPLHLCRVSEVVPCAVLDAFRMTLPGILLLGRVFPVWDIAVYWSAIVVGAAIDARLRRPHLKNARVARCFSPVAGAGLSLDIKSVSRP